MKTNRLLVFSAIVLMGFLSSCQKKCKCDDNQNPHTAVKPKQTITYEYAKKLEKEYVDTRAKPLNVILNQNKIIEGKDVRDVWFDLKTMKEYIAYVEAESKKKGFANLGLRVYLGAYPDIKESLDPGYTTVFFIPTHKSKVEKMNFVYQDPNENSTDIEGLNMGSGSHPPRGL